MGVAYFFSQAHMRYPALVLTKGRTYGVRTSGQHSNSATDN